MKIKGTITSIKREKHLPPDDGVHIASNYDGYLKGSHGLYCGEKLVPKGQNGFYWQIDDKYGVKVFYSLDKRWKPKMKTIKRVFKTHWKLYSVGIAIKPIKIIDVELDIHYDKKHIKENCLGIMVKHSAYPIKAWDDFTHGRPYDWAADEHPDHSPEGFLKFQKQARKAQNNYNPKADVSLKLGDIVWDTNKKRWRQVDVA